MADEEKEISISFDALNGVKPYIQSLVDGNKNFSANFNCYCNWNKY